MMLRCRLVVAGRMKILQQELARRRLLDAIFGPWLQDHPSSSAVSPSRRRTGGVSTDGEVWLATIIVFFLYFSYQLSESVIGQCFRPLCQ
jgi:hypothetical protein